MLQRSNSVDISNWLKEQTKIEAQTAMSKEIKKLLLTLKDRKRLDSMERQLNSFQALYQKYLSTAENEIDWAKISQVDESRMKLYSTLSDVPDQRVREYLQRLAVVKLNGGLGTSMGCTGTKSLITVRSDLTFLDLTIRQIEHLNVKYDCNVPLVLMNSFNTHEETQRVLQKYQMVKVKIFTFVQSMYPRINKESLLPFCSKIYDDNPDSKNIDNSGWYPPGHGDLYRSLQSSGILDQLLSEGIDWIFLSNIDNMGANVDIKILSYLMESKLRNEVAPEFVMEVTDKTRADVKGGTLISYENQLRLLEIAQVPKSRIDEFTSVRKFDIFNTNNLWINLEAIERELLNGTLEMEIIVNHKILDNGVSTIQLEEAAGAAIKSFDNAIGLRVPRSRFLPVKTTSDLLLIMSNLYTMKPSRLVMSPKRDFMSVPIVKLGNHFKKVKDFLSRFENIPDLLELDHLTVSGDVTFGKNVTLKGTVIIIANFGDRINIPDGAILENKIVSGNLRILDH